MRVLVTGATDPVGCHLVRALLADPRVDHVLAQGDTPDATGFDAGPNGRLTYVQVDMARPRDIRTLLFGPARDLRIDRVIHTALAHQSRHRGHRTHALDVASTREIVSLAEDHPTIRRLVYRSSADVYRIDPREPTLMDETHPLELSPAAPSRVRDQVEADITLLGRMGRTRLEVVILRCAEILAPRTGSQLYDYLGSRVCLRPLGFDPMLNLLSIDDTVRAGILALEGSAAGVFNVGGADTLPLSRAVRLWGRIEIPVPGPLLAPLYQWRATATGMAFRYDMNYRRFHFSAVLDGTRAREVLGYEPKVPIRWPAAAASRTGDAEPPTFTAWPARPPVSAPESENGGWPFAADQGAYV